MAAVPSIGRAAPPEAAATQALYERYAPQILRYCLHQLGSREEAEDAVQSTFLNAFRGLRRGIVPDAESAWLFKIAHNVCLSRRRSSRRRGRVESPADFELVAEVAPAPARRADELIGLHDALEGMPAQQRRAILLREWQGLSYREIAEELELSQSAVETLIFRARRSLATGLERPAEEPRLRRSAPAAALGNLLAGAQAWLFGGGAAAVKVAATVAAVGAGTVVVAAPLRHHRLQPPPRPTTPTPQPRHVQPAPVRHVVREPVQQPVPQPSRPATAPAAPVRRPAAAPAHRRARAPKPAPVSRRPRPAAPPVQVEAPAPPAPVEAPPPTPPRRALVRRHTSQPKPAPRRQHPQEHGRATAPGQAKTQPHAAAPPVHASPPGPPPQAGNGNGKK